MSTILEEIVEKTKEDLSRKKKKVAFRDFQSFEYYEADRRSFAEALQQEGEVSIIAEIKKASPSKGVIRSDFDPQRIAGQYQEGGASAISILTDAPFFQGDIMFLEQVREHVEIPLLRKDFIVDPYQIEEAKAHGADAVLLIAAITEGSQLQELQHAAMEAGIAALVECYTAGDFEVIDYDLLDVIGVNNRNLHNFEVDLHRGVSMLENQSDQVVKVSESGLNSVEDLTYLYDHNIDAALIGEHFMRQSNPGKAVGELLDGFYRELNVKS